MIESSLKAFRYFNSVRIRIQKNFSITAVFLFLVMSQITVAQTATAPSGTGTEGDPYLIATLDNLYWLTQNTSEWGDYFLQTADIDASSTSTWHTGSGFSPIGNTSTQFTGTYDGNGYSISELFINRGSTDNVGIFGWVFGGSISNLTITDADITGSSYVGLLAGQIDFSSAISNIRVEGSVTGNGSRVGGIVGYAEASTITKSYVNIDLTGNWRTGGLIGETGSGLVIQESVVTGTVSGDGATGGMVGFLLGGNISNSYSTADVTGTSNNLGGLIGVNESGNITSSYATGSVSGGAVMGGLIGLNDTGNITNSYWNTETSGLANAFGSDNNSESATGLTSAEMLDQYFISDLDYSDVWLQFSGVSEPFLQALAPDSVNGIPFADYIPSGSGTEGDPYQIATLEHLQWLSAVDSVWDAHFDQTADIDASATAGWSSGKGFLPIGYESHFLGTYDGNNHIISGLMINRSEIGEVALFGLLQSATILNLGLTDVSFTGDYAVGGIAGQFLGSTMSNCYSTGTIISSTSDAGGLIGIANSSNISDSYSSTTVSISVYGDIAGGLIASFTNSSITNSYATGTVSGAPDSWFIGGLIGDMNGNSSISNSYATGDVSGSYGVGGLVGSGTGMITNSFAWGDVSDQGNPWDEKIGGLVGEFDSGSINNSYSSGLVTAMNDGGGLVGENSNGTVTGSYWNTETSEQSIGIGNDDNAQTVTGLGIGDMIHEATFSGWDFNSETVWVIDEGFTFPYLKDMSDTRMVVATINGDAGWRMIGHPGDITYNQLLGPIWTQGFEGSDAGTNGSSNAYFYEESTQSWTAPSSADDYFGTNSSEENTALNGLLLYVYADDDNDGSDDSWPKYLVSENSNLNESFDVSLGYTDNVSDDSTGWNLVSNPYPVSLDWTEVVTNEDISNTFPVAYIWDDSLNSGEGAYRINYGYPLPPGLPHDLIFDGPIPAMQSFWVKATDDNASLTFKPDYQSGNKVLYKSTDDEELPDLSWLSLSIKHGDYSDRLTFFTGTKEGKEINVPKLSTIASRYIEFAISNKESAWITRSLPKIESGEEHLFPLDLKTTETGTFSLNWQGLENFEDDWVFVLSDQLTGEHIDLRTGETYTFEVSGEQDPSELKTRFTLSMISGTSVSNEPKDDLPETFALSQNYPNPFNPSTVISYQLPVSSEVRLEVFDMLGRKVATLVNQQMEAGAQQVTFNAKNLSSGVYLYRLQAGNNVFIKKLTLIK